MCLVASVLHPKIQLEPASLEVLVLNTGFYFSCCSLGASLGIFLPTLVYLPTESLQLWSIIFLVGIGLGYFTSLMNGLFGMV